MYKLFNIKIMKKFILLAVVLFLFTACSINSNKDNIEPLESINEALEEKIENTANNENEVEEENKTPGVYENEEYQFKLNYPTTWIEGKNKDSELIEFYKNKLEHQNKILTIHIWDNNEYTKFRENIASAYVTVGLCEISLIKNIDLPGINKHLRIEYLNYYLQHSEEEQDECMKFFTSFPKERQVLPPKEHTGGGYASVYLEEKEIPKEVKNEYLEFKNILDSFTILQ